MCIITHNFTHDGSFHKRFLIHDFSYSFHVLACPYASLLNMFHYWVYGLLCDQTRFLIFLCLPLHAYACPYVCASCAWAYGCILSRACMLMDTFANCRSYSIYFLGLGISWCFMGFLISWYPFTLYRYVHLLWPL